MADAGGVTGTSENTARNQEAVSRMTTVAQSNVGTVCEENSRSSTNQHIKDGCVSGECKKRTDSSKSSTDAFWNDLFEEIGVRQKPRPPPPKTWKDKLAFFAVVCIAIAAITQLCYRFYMDYNYGFDPIDVSDVQLLKEVMFGGRPWIVVCRWPNKRMKLPEQLDKNRLALLRYAKLGSINCGATLPSGVTFAERFRIPNSAEGLILANGRAPRLLTPWALETKSNLLSYVERNTKLEIRTIDDPGSLSRRCLIPSGARCVIMIREGGLSSQQRNQRLQEVFGKNVASRKLKFAVVDRNKHQHKPLVLLDWVNIDVTIMLKYNVILSDENQQAVGSIASQVMCIINTSPREAAALKKRKEDVSNDTFVTKLYRGDFMDDESLSAFALTCATAAPESEGFMPLSAAPSISRI